MPALQVVTVVQRHAQFAQDFQADRVGQQQIATIAAKLSAQAEKYRNQVCAGV